MYQDYTRIKFDRQDTILTVTLSNPESRNSVDEALHHELGRAFREIARDKQTRVVVLTGDPAGKAFCAGGDIEWLKDHASTGEGLAEVVQEGVEIVNSLMAISQPVVSMINGHAIGLGCTIALLCDVQFMAEDARIADPHVGLGVVAGDGGAVIWPLLIGPNRAKEFLMTGDALTGKEAQQIGLVNHAVPADELADRTYAFARRLAGGPRLAIQFTKRSVNLVVQQLADRVLTASVGLEGITFNTADHREAIRAFQAKEKPNWN